MRSEFIPADQAATREDVLNVAPWAARIVPADGGWWAFESVTDFEQWTSQE